MSQYRQVVTNPRMLGVAKELYDEVSAVNKFGRNADVDTATDPETVWGGGGDWVAPTQARVHDIASTSAADAAAGTGARTVRVWGLTGWGSGEVSEDVTLNGTTNVATTNSYVLIHRMLVLTTGSGNTSAGAITATAQTDATVTAQIDAGVNQTLMAVYGVPSTHALHVTAWYFTVNRGGGGTGAADMRLEVCRDASDNAALWLVKSHLSGIDSGSTYMERRFDPYYAVPGPAIVRVQVQTVSANDMDISAGFDAYLVRLL